jgi:hypothetical protein
MDPKKIRKVVTNCRGITCLSSNSISLISIAAIISISVSLFNYGKANVEKKSPILDRNRNALRPVEKGKLVKVEAGTRRKINVRQGGHKKNVTRSQVIAELQLNITPRQPRST